MNTRDTSESSKPLTPQQKEMVSNGTPLASQLPFEFANGEMITEIPVICKKCNSRIPDDMVKGKIIPQTETLIRIEGIGICLPCRNGVPVDFRLRDDMSMEYQSRGIWVRRHPGGEITGLLQDQPAKKLTLGKRIRRLVHTFIGFIVTLMPIVTLFAQRTGTSLG